MEVFPPLFAKNPLRIARDVEAVPPRQRCNGDDAVQPVAVVNPVVQHLKSAGGVAQQPDARLLEVGAQAVHILHKVPKSIEGGIRGARGSSTKPRIVVNQRKISLEGSQGIGEIIHGWAPPGRGHQAYRSASPYGVVDFGSVYGRKVLPHGKPALRRQRCR